MSIFNFKSKDVASHYKRMNTIASLICAIPFPIGGLFTFFGSDKEQVGGHHYGRTYGNLFRRFRYRPIKFLEIGIGGYEDAPGGQSLLSWRAYFPFAKIVACDIVPKQQLTTNRITVYTADQSSAADLGVLVAKEAPFDIILDDGSHFNNHQIFTFETLFPSVKDGGLYIVEDVQTSYWPDKSVVDMDWGGRRIDDPEFSQTCMGYFLELAKYLSQVEFVGAPALNPQHALHAKSIKRIAFEHNLIIIEKGPNTAPSNMIK